MPSPVGHSLVGLAVALQWYVPRRSTWRGLWQQIKKRWKPILAAVIVANLADIDYVPGVLTGSINAYHHFYTHTLGWAVVVTLGIWMCWRAFDRTVGWRQASLLFALLISHLVADWMTADAAEPYGVIALWPLSDQYVISPWSLYLGVKKADWGEVFQFINVLLVAWEALVTLPLVMLVLVLKRRKARPAQ